MLAFGIRYLTGSVAATEPDSHERAEWPPHPGRVFMALAAAHFETGGEPVEREALLWLETLDPPLINAAPHSERALVTHYVPVNDSAGPSKAEIPGIPLTRERQPRTFARALPESDTVYLSWSGVEPARLTRQALEALCGKVTRIGHSSSLVQMWLAEAGETGSPTWVPREGRSAIRLRVPGPGTLLELERRYNGRTVADFADLLATASDETDRKAQKAAKKRIREEFGGEDPPRVRPHLSIYCGYTAPLDAAEPPAPAGTVLDPGIHVLRLERHDGPYATLDLCSMASVIERLREAILSRSDGLPVQVRELLSGHDHSGAPLGRPHLAFLPLAFVGHPHADGHLLGVALAFPTETSAEDRRSAYRAIGAVRRLLLGPLGSWDLVPSAGSIPSLGLRPETWTASEEGARHWASVTPVVFDRHPKGDDRTAYEREVAEMIAATCAHVGLPTPCEVIPTPVSAHPGAPPARSFPRLRRKDGSQRRQVHAKLVFEQKVRGPLLLGAGRYRGYGLFRPMHEAGGPRRSRE
jgi:CRISPR-associated protein Csb2